MKSFVAAEKALDPTDRFERLVRNLKRGLHQMIVSNDTIKFHLRVCAIWREKRVWKACGELFLICNPLIINKKFRVRLPSTPLSENQRVTAIFEADLPAVSTVIPPSRGEGRNSPDLDAILPEDSLGSSTKRERNQVPDQFPEFFDLFYLGFETP